MKRNTLSFCLLMLLCSWDQAVFSQNHINNRLILEVDLAALGDYTQSPLSINPYYDSVFAYHNVLKFEKMIPDSILDSLSSKNIATKAANYYIIECNNCNISQLKGALEVDSLNVSNIFEKIYYDYVGELLSCTNPVSLNDPYPNTNLKDYVNLPCAWEISTGQNTRIGVIDYHKFSNDASSSYNHEDIAPNVERILNVSSYANNHVHGTVVAGIAGAKGNNSIGVPGVAYNAGLHLYHGLTTSEISTAIYDAIATKVDVINISAWVFAGAYQAIKDAIANDVNVVIAAGNQPYYGTYNYACSADPSVVCVTTTYFDGNINTAYCKDTRIDISSVGGGFDACSNVSPFYHNLWGTYTSFSSPIVTGVISLMKSVNPDMKPSEVRCVLKGTANSDILSNPVNQPYAGTIGAGRVDAYEAVKMAQEMALPSVIANGQVYYWNSCKHPTLHKDITIQNGGLLIVEGGASLHLPAGRKITVQGTGELRVENGAYFCAESGSSIYLADYASKFELGTSFISGIRPDAGITPATSCLDRCNIATMVIDQYSQGQFMTEMDQFRIFPARGTFCKNSTLITSENGIGESYYYQWKKNGVNISGATNAEFQLTEAGSYTISVEVSGNTNGVVTKCVVVSNETAPQIVKATNPLGCGKENISVTSNCNQGETQYLYRKPLSGVGFKGTLEKVNMDDLRINGTGWFSDVQVGDIITITGLDGVTGTPGQYDDRSILLGTTFNVNSIAGDGSFVVENNLAIGLVLYGPVEFIVGRKLNPGQTTLNNIIYSGKYQLGDFDRNNVSNELTLNVHPCGLQFDGVDDYVTVSNINFGNTIKSGTMTLEARVNLAARTGDFDNVFLSFPYNGGYLSYGHTKYGSQNEVYLAYVDFWDEETYYNRYASAALPLDATCVHVAVTREADGRVTHFINGVQQPRVSGFDYLDPLANAPATMYMGKGMFGNFKGTLSNIRIWNIVRTQQQLAGFQDKSLLGTETGLLAYYQFLEKGEQTIYSTVNAAQNIGQLGSLPNSTDQQDPSWVTVTNCHNVAREGIQEEEVATDSDIKLYPNPFSEGFDLEVFDTQADTYSFEIYNLQGMKVMEKTGLPVGAVHSEAGSTLPSGMYLIKVRIGSKAETLRLMKLR